MWDEDKKMQNLIVFAVCAFAALYISMIIYKALKKDPDCGCRCSSCNLADSCEDPRKSENRFFKRDDLNAGQD
jgi:hypothetical protein